MQTQEESAAVNISCHAGVSPKQQQQQQQHTYTRARARKGRWGGGGGMYLREGHRKRGKTSLRLWWKAKEREFTHN